MKWKLAIVFVLLWPLMASAEILPHYPSTYELGGGYTLFSDEPSGMAVEHMDTKDSFGIAADIETYPLPTRFHLELSLLSPRDLYLDTGLAYRDILLSRFIATRSVHNIENPSLSEKDPDTTHLYHDQALQRFYTLRNSFYDLNLRLKAPGYPFHLFGKYLAYHQKGTVEQNYLIGYFTTNMDIYSKERPTKKKTETYSAGVNGHFGPLEGEYLYTYKTFDPSGTTVLYDNYPQILSRQPGTYAHNLLPELTSSSHTFKVHTNYTGRIVASVTVSSSTEENNYSDVTRDILRLSTGLRYLPAHWLTLSLQGTYQKTKEDAPLTTTINNQYTYSVRRPPEVETSNIKATLRLRPLGKLTLLLDYKFQNKNLSQTADWPLLKGDGQYQSLGLKAMAPVGKVLKIRAVYNHEENDPVYNTEPDSADSVHLLAEVLYPSYFTPVIYYQWKNSERKGLKYYNTVNQNVFNLSEKRKATYQQAGIMIPFSVGETITITPSFYYASNKISGPLSFLDISTGADLIYDAQKYTEEALTYNITCQAKLNDLISGNLWAGYTTSHGSAKLHPSVSNMEPFFKHSYRTTELGTELSIKTLQDIFLKPSITYIHYKDRTGVLSSGDAYRTMLFLSKRF